MRKLRFHLDRIVHCKAYGWVLDEYALHHRLFIKIAINNIVIASDYANIYRQDLRDHGLGEGSYGFEIYLGDLPTGTLTIFADQELVFSKSFDCLHQQHKHLDLKQFKSPVYLSIQDISALENLLSQRRPAALFFFGITAFYPRIQRHQQLAYEFAYRDFDVFFIEPIFRGGKTYRFQCVDQFKNIYLINLPTYGQSAHFIEGYFDIGILEYWRQYLNQITQFYSMTYCIWGSPQWLLLIHQSITFNISIFDFIDDYRATFSQPRLETLFKQCIHRVDGVIYTSTHLPFINQCKRKKHIQVRNGFSSQLRLTKRSQSTSRTLGYVGALDEINGHWIFKFLNVNRVSALIIGSGTLSQRLSDFASAYQDICILGEMSHTMAMSYLTTCRFGMVFFRSQKIAQWVNPVKCYEYIALGMPTLASHEIDIEPELRECVSIVPYSRMTVSYKQQNQIEARFSKSVIKLDLEKYSWENRCQQIESFFNSF